jgi:hypothetical protein
MSTRPVLPPVVPTAPPMREVRDGGLGPDWFWLVLAFTLVAFVAVLLSLA